MTHAELVKIAAAHLRKSCFLVITEITSGCSEQPDAFGYDQRGSILIECKASRTDFLSDKKKWFRRHPESGIAGHRYYMAPKGLIAIEELPAKWGLLELDANLKVRVVQKSEGQPHNVRSEQLILLSAFRRVGPKIGLMFEECGVSVKLYTYETQNRATLGLALDADDAEKGEE